MPAGGVADRLADGPADARSEDGAEAEGVADGTADGLGAGLSAATAGAVAVSTSENDNRAAEVTSKEGLAVLFMADTVENVQGVARDVARASSPISLRTEAFAPRRDAPWSIPPRVPAPFEGGDTEPMKLSRPVSWFLLAFGVWSWVIWVTFVKNLWADGSGLAFDDAGDPTGYFWVHLTLAVVSFVLGTVVGGIGLRGVRALRATQSP